jgi:23S rRNA (uracil1939-C5)-methyltransferase
VIQRRNRRISRKPVSKLSRIEGPTETLELEITDLSASGSGVARDPGGRVIFVPFTMPGDLVLVNVKAVSKRYAQAEVVELLRPAPDRVKPPCAVFGRCGGCQWQHVPYELQFRTKSRGLLHALERRQIKPAFEPELLPAERIWEYRNRIQLRGRGSSLGFFARESHDLVEIARCEIARPELNAMMPAIGVEGLAQVGPYRVEIGVQPDGSVTKAWNGTLGFRQVHDEQNEKLQAWVGSAVRKGRILYDLYGGAGNLSVNIADSMTEVHCVDRVVPDEKLTKIEFHAWAVEPWLKRAAKDERLVSLGKSSGASAVLDPPREGLGEDFGSIERSLRQLHVDEVVAVGCDANSFAQDLSRFIGLGWKLERLAVLDLFPQTPHVEGIALLRL